MEKKYPIGDENKLTPEQIEERKEAIDWYRNPAAPLNPDLEEQANTIYQKYCNEKGLDYHLINAANFCLGYMAGKEVGTEPKYVADRLRAIQLTDIDAPIFTHTKEFEAHFSYIKGKFIELINKSK